MLGYLPYLLEGALVSLAIAAASAIVAVAVAFLAAFARLSSSRWLRASAACYVEFFRGTSLLVQLFWLFFVLPQFGVLLNAYVVAVLALGLNIGAYGSEVVRGAIVSTAQGQLDAAKALNMSPRLAMPCFRRATSSCRMAAFTRSKASTSTSIAARSPHCSGRMAPASRR